MLLVWGVVGLVLAALLVVGWLMDRSVRRRGSRVTYSGDVWREVREGRRDAEVTNPFAGKGDYSWSSWNRRNRR
jgi:hypothetical protein